MCYDGALRFMRRAAKSIDLGDRDDASYATGRAQAIVNELNVTLDMDAGGEIATNLRSLYLFVNRHLSDALVSNEASKVRESMNVIGDLRGAWAQAMNLNVAAA